MQWLPVLESYLLKKSLYAWVDNDCFSVCSLLASLSFLALPKMVLISVNDILAIWDISCMFLFYRNKQTKRKIKKLIDYLFEHQKALDLYKSATSIGWVKM